MNIIITLQLMLFIVGILSIIVFIAYMPVIISRIKIKKLKKELDEQIRLLPETFKNCIQIETRPLGLGSIACEYGTVRFEDVQKHSDMALKSVLKLTSEMKQD